MFVAWVRFTFYAYQSRFEKSLYDLIRGLRSHKGTEREYIQSSLRECRTEIRGSDIGSLHCYFYKENEDSFCQT